MSRTGNSAAVGASDSLTEIIERNALLQEYLPKIRDIVSENLGSVDSAIGGPLARFRERPGKMLRSSLLILSAAAGNPDYEKMCNLAASVELLHLATLIHDDILDASDRRRGVPTIHTTNGIRSAVLAGDYLFTRCFSLTADYASPETAKILSAGVGRICEAEISQSNRDLPGLRTYLRKSAGKTALLFMLSSWMGAKEAGCDTGRASWYRSFGYALGMAFQIRDDILDFIGDEASMGKPVEHDLEEKLMTLPVVLAAKNNYPEVTGLLHRRLTKRRAAKIRAAVRSEDLIRLSQDYVDYYTERAVKALTGEPAGPNRHDLEAMALAMSTRAA